MSDVIYLLLCSSSNKLILVVGAVTWYSRISKAMSCKCMRKAYYVLKCSDVPADLFIAATCSIHEKGTRSSSTQDVCVSLTLCPDFAVSESEDISKWPVVYHGTDVSVVNSILTHGMLLMAGDSMQDGTVINTRHGTEYQESAVWTYPQPDGAKIAAGIETFDNGKTEFQILIRLRQQPHTYELHKKGGFGYDIWSTKRRGTLFIEGLDVFVFKSRGTVTPSPFISIPQNSYKTKFDCSFQRQAFKVLKMLRLPEGIFNMAHNRCYCSNCYPVTWPDSMDVGGEKYAIPRGWTRFGLATNPVFAKLNDIWRSWHIAFHGCHPSNVISIMKSRSLLIPHDILPNGRELKVCSSVDKKQKYYFLSPEIGYSAHPWYAKPVPFTDKDGRKKYFQTVLVFKVIFRAVIITSFVGNASTIDSFSLSICRA